MGNGDKDTYKFFFDRAPNMLAVCGFDGYFRELNPEWEKTLGFTSGELLKKPYLSIVHPDDAGAARQAEKRVLAGERGIQLETRCLCKDGSYKWLAWRCSADSADSLFYASAEDITARKMTEAAIRESEATLRRILDLAPMSMSIVNIDGTIEYINRKAEETFGFRHDEIPTMDRWWEQAYPDPVYRKEVVERWMGRVYKAFENKTEIVGGDYNVTCKDGTVKSVFIFGVIAAVVDRLTQEARGLLRRMKAHRVLGRAMKSNLLVSVSLAASLSLGAGPHLQAEGLDGR